jgi:signal transduction histidine kinase
MNQKVAVAAPSWARLLGWGILALTLLITAVDVVLLALNLAEQSTTPAHAITNPSDLPLRFELPIFAIFLAGVGALVAVRQPRNGVGWILAGLGLEGALQAAMTEYGHLAQVHPALPAGEPASALAGNYGQFYFLASFTFISFLFPTGRFVSSRWKRVGWIGAGLLALGVGLRTVPSPGPMDTILNHVSALPLDLLTTVAPPLAAVASMVVRYRQGGVEERQQIKWILYASAVVLVGATVPSAVGPRDVSGTTFMVWSVLVAIGIATILLIPIAAGVAIFKYRLYDIDIVISRTIVYGSLAAFITAVYVGIAVGIGALVGGGGKPNLGLSILATGIVAVGFQPVRERVQRVANRLVYGTRATPYEVLSQFSERVAESYASEDVLPRMARVLGEGTNADLAAVWLRHDDALQRAAVFPLDEAVPAAVHLNGTALAIPGADRAVVVRHQGEVLGALTITKRRGEQITPIEVKLMDDLAHQAGLVLKNVGLTADLQARLVDLRASRQRLVAAQDDERRRLERNLHDGAQQHLVALKVKLGLAEMLATRDPERARATVAELKHDADEALETLRDLARGIYPPLLADRGLPTALQAQARKATLPVTIEADGIGRYSQDTEAALYFCILEALQNIQKYAQASRAVVRLREDGDKLSVEVLDDGRGFDVASTSRGNGLTNMEDRLDALGGTLYIVSSPGSGTTLRVILPVLTPAVLIKS